MSTPETTILQLRKNFKTPCLCKAEVVGMLAFCNLGSEYRYKKWKKAGILKPLRKIDGGTQSRYDREHVLELISERLNTDS